MQLRNERLPREVLTWRMLLVQAFFNSIGAWTILAWGQQYLDSGLASVLNSTAPIFVFFATWLITRHEAVNSLKLLGALLGLVGVVLIVGIDALGGLGKQVLAQLAVITGAILYACAAIYGRRFSGQPAIVTAAGTMIWASVCLVPLSLLVDRAVDIAAVLHGACVSPFAWTDLYRRSPVDLLPSHENTWIVGCCQSGLPARGSRCPARRRCSG